MLRHRLHHHHFLHPYRHHHHHPCQKADRADGVSTRRENGRRRNGSLPVQTLQLPYSQAKRMRTVRSTIGHVRRRCAERGTTTVRPRASFAADAAEAAAADAAVIAAMEQPPPYAVYNQPPSYSKVLIERHKQQVTAADAAFAQTQQQPAPFEELEPPPPPPQQQAPTSAHKQPRDAAGAGSPATAKGGLGPSQSGAMRRLASGVSSSSLTHRGGSGKHKRCRLGVSIVHALAGPALRRMGRAMSLSAAFADWRLCVWKVTTLYTRWQLSHAHDGIDSERAALGTLAALAMGSTASWKRTAEEREEYYNLEAGEALETARLKAVGRWLHNTNGMRLLAAVKAWRSAIRGGRRGFYE